MERIFLGWDRPALPAAVERLVAMKAASGDSNGRLALGDTIVAVPGGRAGRRLLEILVERCKREGLVLQPPQIVTIGRLPELLYEAKRPLADDLTQRLAWVEALKHLSAGDTDSPETVTIFQRPADDDLETWLSLAAMFSRLHRELAADALDCNNVADCGQRIEGFTETRRWKLLAEAQAAYLQTLDELGLWDRQTARLFAIMHGECRVDRNVVLVGLVDMNRAQRRMLDQLGPRVTALIFAPEELADRFDEHGCLCPKAWLEADIGLTSEQIEVVDSSADQAAAVARAIASFDGQFSAEDVVVGVPDVRLVPHIQRLLRQHDVCTRYGVGRPVSLSSPYRFLADVAEYVSNGSYSAFASLVRHPRVGDWLRRQGVDDDWLTALDRFYQSRLPHRLDKIVWKNNGDDNPVTAVYESVQRLVGILDGQPQRLDLWGEPLLELLLSVFAFDGSGGRVELDRTDPADRQVLVCCEKIHDVLRQNSQLPERLMPVLCGAEAVRLVLRELDAEAVAPLPQRGVVELLGWLELPWDDSPAMVVTGMNEGIVPSSLNADLFLPNKLRRALGLEDNDRRYARDAYALSLLAASRPQLRVIAGRRTPDSDPLSPSRLFFATDEETIARRSAAFFDAEESPAATATLLSAVSAVREESDFRVPAPRPLTEPVQSMRVTEFRDYLACPYRYYLRHRLQLESLDDAAVELDGGAFGTLAHDVLQRFGKSELVASTLAEPITNFLSQTLDRLVRRSYGDNPLAAIRVQVEQLRRRLQAFARWQAGWAAEGWRIELVEFGPKDGAASITVDGEPMFLRGRIDRIDVNRLSGRVALFDYKTSDTLKTPRQAHMKKGQWTDLQLPLYRHLVEGMDFAGEIAGIELGYIVLPKDIGKAGYQKADWNSTELTDADETAAQVVRAVREERFFPPSLEPPAFSEDFAAICQDNRIGRPLLEEAAWNTQGGAK